MSFKSDFLCLKRAHGRSPTAKGMCGHKYSRREIDASQAERLGCLSIARCVLSLARSTQAERDNESRFFVRAAGFHRFIRRYHFKKKMNRISIRLEPTLPSFNYAPFGVSGLVPFCRCDWPKAERMTTKMTNMNIGRGFDNRMSYCRTQRRYLNFNPPLVVP
ncbi:hypothetical protein EVAR_61431_1 [Eumeta japonica]|uniref:Uncharacterized protein n=1 Tax=Eumeta variegata TaxID=151549 RepID=A0A4C1Y3P6_EUMVA|nr:hypothetical protein EVAR_61431_1 [Eumeta japonica]